MRKARTLVGLTLIALGAEARAQDNVAAPPAPAPPPTAAATNPSPAAAPTTPAAAPPAPAGTVGTLVPAATPAPAAAAPAPAGTVGTLVPAAPYEPPPRRIEVGLSLLPMGRGKITSPSGATEVTGDALFAYGFGLSASYRAGAGLHVGLAPQVIYNVNYKVNPSQLAAPPAATEYDVLARVEYELPLVDTIALYAEALPGYSLIVSPGSSTAKGLVLVLGGGVSMDMSNRIFVNMGVGYQLGYQSVSIASTDRDNRTQYLRVELGGGVRF